MAEALARDGRLLEVEAADFGLLFPLFDAFIVHGGLTRTLLTIILLTRTQTLTLTLTLTLCNPNPNQVHGGLGTTVEALRTRRPVAVTGLLLMDQRFWGGVVEAKRVGPPAVHLDAFKGTCVDFVDRALDEDSEWRANAEALWWGEPGDDGVAANVEHFEALLAAGVAPIRNRARLEGNS